MPVSSFRQHEWLYRCRFSPDAELLDTPTRMASTFKTAVQRFIEAHRQQGYRFATLDPLAGGASAAAQSLSAEQFGLAGADAVAQDGGTLLGARQVQELDQRLKSIYCGTLALDCSAVRDEARAAWLYGRMEAMPPSSSLLRTQGAELLARLVSVQTWERHVAQHYPHAKRFSLEGCEALIPLLDALIEQASARGIGEVLLGMPHRGRINALVHVLGVPAQQLLDYFELNPPLAGQQTDLVYHLGARRRVNTRSGAVELNLAYNPSHLQSVYPVVLGMARAVQDRPQRHSPGQALAVVLHGDAAFAGQGVVMESLLLADKPGYSVGGTVHVVINNQMGFTEPNLMDAQRPRYCTDVTRMVDAPVLRVSADAPEQLLRAAEIALGYRAKFGADIFIDLVGYRRPGHSEHDVPAMTSPQRQARIDSAPSVIDSFSERLQAAGLGGPAELAGFVELSRIQALQSFTSDGRTKAKAAPLQPTPMLADGNGDGAELPSQAQLQALVKVMCSMPDGFQPHPMVQTLIEDWQAMAASERAAVDWRFAENMAYATLLQAGIGVRISGMDVQRGTFFHRQAVWHGQQTDDADPRDYQPLARLAAPPARFDVFNSQLSEEAVLGFEYGYSVEDVRRLVIWEAQFGDFVNGAQVYVDQYIAAGEAKWGSCSALTVLLPHGYEGVGPEHSSGFLSRFLQLCAQDNLRVVCPSTSGQFFHLLRRQALASLRKPLIVMTPKGVLYETAESHSPLHQLLAGRFHCVLDDEGAGDPAEVERLVLSSGKLHYDLLRGRRAQADSRRCALLRIEQLYPFPREELARLLSAYPAATELVWAQEEQLNQGAWHFVRDELALLCQPGQSLRCVAPASTAAGASASLAAHRNQQQAVVAQALGMA